MPFFEWDIRYSVHVDQFDKDHKELIRLLNEAHENYQVKACEVATRVIIDRLVDYAQYHFTAEEKWMKARNYESLASHTAEHDAFWRKIYDFQTEYHNGKKQLSFELLNFLKEWLSVHILTTDAEYGRFAAPIIDLLEEV
jgi:hemerythrin